MLANSDSEITILENNPRVMEDADLQTVFACMDMGDYTTALSKVGALLELEAIGLIYSLN